jgi:RNA polymerase sigma-70 factor, ECF subfamily
MLQSAHPQAFSQHKFPNANDPEAVFMIEGRRVVAGEAILSRPAATERSNLERVEARDARRDEMLETLVRQYSRLVYRINYALLRSHQDAEDATQETFLRVLRYSAKLDVVEDPKTWLARIAWRVAVDRSKQRARKREIALEDSPEPQANETAYGTQMGAVLEKLVAALPVKLRQPLILSAIEELSPRDIGSALGINETAVRSRLFRARQILRKKLAQTIGERT